MANDNYDKARNIEHITEAIRDLENASDALYKLGAIGATDYTVYFVKTSQGDPLGVDKLRQTFKDEISRLRGERSNLIHSFM